MIKFKRFLSALLAVVMVVSLIPLSSITASAATTISLNRPLDTAYTITAREYYSSGSYHGAIDYGCPKGTPVYAAESGTITVHDGGYGDGYYGCKDGNGWGNYADISHGNGYSTRYAHMSTGRFVVSSGSYVQRGQLIGYSGHSGNSTGAHLHFGLYLNGTKVYPEPYIKTATGYFNPTTHTVDSSHTTNFTAYPKAKITAANIIDANHNQISSGAWIGTSDLCTIHEVYTDGCCKVTYPLDNGGTKTVYSKISLFRASVPSVKYWVSSTEYGDEVTEGTAGNSYYLCYYLYDKISKKDWDEVVSSNYEIRLTIYNPDGSVNYTNENKFDYDRSWIRSFLGKTGTYKVEVSASGDYSGTFNKSFTVKANPIEVNCSKSSVSLKLGETESETIYAGYSGYYDGNWVLNYQRSNSNVSCTWGDWTDDHRSPLTIKANTMGTTTVTISIKDKDTGAVLDSTTVTVSVGAKSYTVSYNANGGSGAPSSQTKYYNTTLTLSSTKPTRTGYTFLGWSTSSTATSATYQSGGSFVGNTNTTLYAVWKANTYTVSYNANGGSGAPSSQTKTHDVSLTLSSTKPTRTGYTFLGWSTSSTASSATYQPGGSFTGNANTTLYAVWKANSTALSVNSTNSAVVSTGGEMKYFTFTPSTSGKYVIYSTGSEDTKVYLYNASGTELDSDDDDGDGNNFRLEYSLTAGTTYTFGIKYYNSSKTGTISFKFGNVYTVTYNANGGSGAPSAQSKDYGTNITLSSTAPAKTGYTFLGWATSSTATSATYQPGDSFTSNANTTLYAVWKANTYTISYNANGGSGTMSNSSHTYDVSKALSSNVYTRSGYTFLGWANSSSATTAIYTNGQSVKNLTSTNNATVILYAVWKQGCENGTHTYNYTATKAPTASATGTLTGTCSKCSGTTTVTLPKLNTTDYSYSVRSAATCTVAGSGRYTWKTTTYGSFYFDISISATGHNYSNGSCTRCGATDPNHVIDQNAPMIMVDTVNGKPGETVTVTVSMKNNPGFGGMAYDIEYDSAILELVSYEIGLGNAICTDSGVGTYTNKVNLQYAGTSNITGDGALVTLTFKIKASAPEGTALISIVPEDGTFFTYEGRNEKDFSVSCVNGGVKVVKYISGDINGDGKVNNRDAARLLQKLAGWDVDYVDATLDVNGDGKVNNRDAARILQYLAGWDVELH